MRVKIISLLLLSFSSTLFSSDITDIPLKKIELHELYFIAYVRNNGLFYCVLQEVLTQDALRKHNASYLKPLTHNDKIEYWFNAK
jgi:hypothetical protein